VWDVESADELQTLTGHTQSVNSVSWSRDGKRLASGSLDQTVKVWDLKMGKDVRTLRGHTNSVNSVTWSEDGKRLASGSLDGKVKVWDVETAQELLSLTDTGVVYSASWNEDGTRLASNGLDGTIQVWDGRPWTAELKAKYQARWRLNFLCARVQSHEQLLQAIRVDQTISEPVRQQALKWASRYWEGFVAQRATARE